jgi:hypothetical protein
MASLRLALGLFVVLALAATTASMLHQDSRLAATLADAPSLRLHFTLKRSSMKIFGQLEFDVFANPVVSDDSTTVRYDGVATFKDGDTRYTFVLVGGIAYFVTSAADGSVAAECSSSSSLDLLNAILPALNDATPISSAVVDEKEIKCPSGGLFKVVLDDATFVLCTSGFAGITVYGSDLDIHVKYLASRVPITAPKLSDEEARSCKTMVEPCSVTATTLSFLTAEPVVNDQATRSLKHYLGHFVSFAR